MKDDQRVAITKRLLREGLFRLLEEKDLNKISVTELCTESGINRATFYRHYEEPRDILDELRRDMFGDVGVLGRKAVPNGGLKKWIQDTCRYFYENSKQLIVLFRCRTDDDFVVLLNDLYLQQIHELKEEGVIGTFDDDFIRVGTYFYAGGIFYILRQWLMEPINKSPEEMAELIYKLLRTEHI